MNQNLLIAVRLYEGWYHAPGDGPSPARMFQALVAGAGLSGPLDKSCIASLTWLERQPPPILATPYTTKGQPVVNYVPNNDLDAKQGDHRRIGQIRTRKLIVPRLFDEDVPFLFVWTLNTDEQVRAAQGVLPLVDRVYQLGRTVDAAWAWGTILSANELHDQLHSYPGLIRYPTSGTGHIDCPTHGSLDSLQRRHAAASQRFGTTADRKGQTFRRRPKPRWQKISYEGHTSQLIFELRRSDDTGFSVWPLERAAALVELVRDGVVERLRNALKDRGPDIDRTLIGRKRNGENDGPTSARVRIIPLPSIGHAQSDLQIRRVLIDIPGECPLDTDDIAWAVSGLQLTHPILREPVDVTPAADTAQLKFFGVNRPSRIWHSITPVALSDVPRRRIDPVQSKVDPEENKGSQERYHEELQAARAVGQALRHAGVRAGVDAVRVQKEPFDLRGTRVEPFAEETRFSKHSLWHLELEFDRVVSGPLLIGNGRFLGLGLMRPVHALQGQEFA